MIGRTAGASWAPWAAATFVPIRDRANALATGLVSVFAGAGVLLVALADLVSRRGGDEALLLFWPGILLIVTPAAFLLIQGAPRREVGQEASPAVHHVDGAVSVADARALGPGNRATVLGALTTPLKALERGRRTALLNDGSDVIVIDVHGRIKVGHEPGEIVAVTGRLIQRRRDLALRATPAGVRAVPEAARAASARDPADGRRLPGRNERAAILLVVGLALYLVKVMTSPLGLTGPDEFTHWRTMEDILRTGHLFADNPLLRISPIYPGLEAAAAGATATTGLDVLPIAIVLIGAAKVVTVLGVFLVAVAVTGSSRVAGLAGLVYMANPSFLLFDAAFSYESLAIPLALVAIWATLQWQRHGGRVGLHAGLALTSIAATTVTHHLTSLVLLGLLLAWAVVWFVRDRRRVSGRAIVVATAWALACDAAWLAIAGTLALSYLGFIVQGGVRELVGILSGNSEPRQLFAQRPGLVTPPGEVAMAYGAIFLLMAGLPFMIRHAIRQGRPSAIVIVLALAALVYPASLALRFTTLGAETSQRASEFLFIAIGILGADWLLGSRWTDRRPPGFLLAPILVVIFAGGIVAGAPLLARLPGPYIVAAEQRSIEPQGIQTAQWALRELGPDNRVIADRTNAKLLGSIGLQYPVTAANEHLGTAFVMFARTLGPEQVDLMRLARITYVVVDLRLSTDLPAYPFYFESAEPNAGAHTEPIPVEALTKFEGRPGVLRIYDSGDIRIYDVRGLVDAPQ